MTKFIYYSDRYRCRVKYRKTFDHYELQPQRKWFIFWLNFGEWMAVSDGFWSTGSPVNPIVGRFAFGNKHESWRTNTLDISKRCMDLVHEYIKAEEEKSAKMDRIEGTMNQNILS